MPLRVYVDLAFAVNAVIDYLLLVCSARLSGGGHPAGAAAFGSGAGGRLCRRVVFLGAFCSIGRWDLLWRPG